MRLEHVDNQLSSQVLEGFNRANVLATQWVEERRQRPIHPVNAAWADLWVPIE